MGSPCSVEEIRQAGAASLTALPSWELVGENHHGVMGTLHGNGNRHEVCPHCELS